MNNPDRVRIFSHVTRSRFLHIEDSLMANRKLRFFVGSFERGHGANATAYAFLDVDDARVIMSDLSWSKAVDFADFKGGRDSNEAMISRVLKIRTKEDKVWVEVKNGVGKEFVEGAVRPDGEPFADVSIPLTIPESRKMAFAALGYIQAWEVGMWIRSTALPTCNVSTVEALRRTGQVR